MSASGRIKFLSLNKARVNSGAAAFADDGSGDASQLLNDKEGLGWVGVNAPQTTITISTPPITVNRILIVDHNLAEFEISNAGFRNIEDINGDRLPDGAITVTNNFKGTSYFAFDTVPSLASFTITLGNPFDNLGAKRIGRIILCTEIGTLLGYPEIGEISFDPSSRDIKAKSGEQFITKQNDVLRRIPLRFKNYSKHEDIMLLTRLRREQTPFLMWLCGGNEEQFRFPIEGMRLQDVYKVQTKGAPKYRLQQGNYQSLIDASITFVEAV